MEAITQDHTPHAPVNRHDALLGALKATFDMADEDASAIADVVDEMFNGETEVADENLDADVRSIFYTLEAKKILGFRREDRVQDTGARVRAFFWHFRDDALRDAAGHGQGEAELSVYDSLPADAWSRRAT